MKIGILGTRGIPNHYGGFEQFAEFLAPELVKRGHEVFVYNSDTHPNQQKVWKGVNIVHCKDPENKLGTFGQFFYDLNCNKDARKRNYDVLLHLGYSSDSVWWRRWPKNSFNIVNMDGLEWKRTKYNWLTRKFLMRAESLAAKHSHSMISDSKAMQDYLFGRYKKKSTFIPYAATVFPNPDPSSLSQFSLKPSAYSLLIARMERENNIEIIIKGYLRSGIQHPLFIVGGLHNRTGKHLTQLYQNPNIIFAGGIYDARILNNLRYHSQLYFHGHSVGGTNPSLLEAMACNCRVVAHDNPFNKAVLGNDAHYFSTESDIANMLNTEVNTKQVSEWKAANVGKIKAVYNEQKIVDAYERLMIEVVGRR